MHINSSRLSFSSRQTKGESVGGPLKSSPWDSPDGPRPPRAQSQRPASRRRDRRRADGRRDVRGALFRPGLDMRDLGCARYAAPLRRTGRLPRRSAGHPAARTGVRRRFARLVAGGVFWHPPPVVRRRDRRRADGRRHGRGDAGHHRGLHAERAHPRRRPSPINDALPATPPLDAAHRERRGIGAALLRSPTALPALRAAFTSAVGSARPSPGKLADAHL
jgi:hypothetical protein